MTFFATLLTAIGLCAMSLIAMIILVCMKKHFQIQVACLISTFLFALMIVSLLIANGNSTVTPLSKIAYNIDELTTRSVTVKGVKYDLSNEYVTITNSFEFEDNAAVIIPTQKKTQWLFGLTFTEDYTQVAIYLEEDTFDAWTAANKNKDILIYKND